MTIHFTPKLGERKPPPLRRTAADAKFVALRDAAADAQNHPEILGDLVELLGNILEETKRLQTVWALRGRVDVVEALVPANDRKEIA